MGEPKPLYAVLTRSGRLFDTSMLALRIDGNSHNGGFWTTDDPDDIRLVDIEEANRLAKNLGYNAPQVYGSAKAIKIITAQRDAAAALKAAPVDEDPGFSP